MIKWIMILLIFILSLCVSTFIFAYFENRRFKITEYTIRSPKIKSNVAIAVIADLHNYEYGPGNERVMKALEGINPTFVISAGDMVEAGIYVKTTRRTVQFLKELSKRFDFIYGLGNHEWKLMHDKAQYKIAAPEFEDEIGKWIESGYNEFLDNKIAVRENVGVTVYGLNLDYDYFKKLYLNRTTKEHIAKLVGEPSDNSYNILVGHNPDQLDAYADWGADLVLSGHVHGGMICLPGGRAIIHPKFTLFPKYYAGVYHKDKTDMVVSRGLGNHSVHLRIFNRAEIVVIHLCPQEPQE